MTTNNSTGSYPARRLGPVAILLASTVAFAPQMLQAQTPSSSASSTTRSSAATASTGAGYSGSNRSSTDDTDDTNASGSNAYGNTTDATTSPQTNATSTVGSTALRGSGMLQGSPLNQADSLNADDLNQLIEAPAPVVEEPIEGGETRVSADDGMGIRLGTFTLRPSVNQSINSERTRSAGRETNRSYLATTGNLELRSNWSRHALTVTAAGTREQNISGTGSTDPQASLNADLRLDFAQDTVANLTAGYAYQREDANDPNAIANALTQSDVNRYTGGAAIERDLGILRGTAAIAATRTTYGSVRLSDGRVLSLADRDRTAIQGRLRLGYELSPALIPFIEATLGRAVYDSDVDASGYMRSSYSYGARAGVQLDLGEKLRGELGLGYATVDYEDARLASLGAFTTDGTLAWSPQRGTTVDASLRTTIQDSTAPGANGWVEYQLSSGLSHQIITDLTGRLTGSTTLRDFPNSTDEVNWQLGAGLIWNINRYFDVTANIGYEHTDNASAADSNLVRVGVGLSLRR